MTNGARPTSTSASASAPDHLLEIDDLGRDGLERVLGFATGLKADGGSTAGAGARVGVEAGDGETTPLPRGTLGMLFEKPSTRTRVSFETGMTQLGGHAIFLGRDDIQLGRGEPIGDTARALSRYVDAIMARVYDHGDLERLAAHATVPVINGLSDRAHPCQALADLLTIRERFGGFEGVRAAWVGDGNNVARSFALGCAMVGIELTVATPPGYALEEGVIERAGELGPAPTITEDPAAAVADADVVYTDVWISMGEEDERERRLEAFEGYQVNEGLLEAAPSAAVMHCLPAHRGEEITDGVLEGERSIVFDQAENRLHAQKGLLVYLLADDDR